MKVGDRVRVKAPLMLFNHPQHRNQPFNVEGMEGTVTAVLKNWEGRPISANYQIVTAFEIEGAKRPFKAHLHEDELEVIE
ncbi:MAG: Ferredoxin thioredoxin reductase variable alpha chain [Phormidesmis priestleyi Ana]|uniref:Ferredoxin thioredoxin reductase variable alpha chain n=1 Tax=Phormidesmis priestleyi Ana TaxID=1666911 RepID=A0A0P7YS52_9CYAN|nr:MAG: Ferredoxin thioredoxin reductase variable alpha chain [Phormidesmis priestleyi Ana]